MVNVYGADREATVRCRYEYMGIVEVFFRRIAFKLVLTTFFRQ